MSLNNIKVNNEQIIRIDSDISNQSQNVIPNCELTSKILKTTIENKKFISKHIDMEYIDVIEDSFISNIGTVIAHNSMKVYVYEITENESYIINAIGYSSGWTGFYVIHWFDENDQPLCGTFYTISTDQNFQNEIVTAPSNTKYAKISLLKSQLSSFYFKCLQIDDYMSNMTCYSALPSCDLNNLRQTGTWLLIDANTYEHVPNNSSVGFIRVSYTPSWCLQEFIPFGQSEHVYYKRKFTIETSAENVEDWTAMGGTTTIDKNYTFNEYQQTVNITASPQITTSTNNYLISTNDSTDRTTDILSMLQSTGVCNLGPGDFWIDCLIMPDNSSILGSGTSTKIYLKTGDNKFAIKASNYCIIKNIQIFGDTQSISTNSNIGTRHGILWQGNFSQVQTTGSQPWMLTLSNLYISRFSGGGITCYDTGYGTQNYINATNCNIQNCTVGLNISYWSEYHKFTNIRTYNCYYGCINNGGNNIFVNCDFSSCNELAFLMDNSQNQSPNNSHGSCIGCIFNHTASNGHSNSGTAVRVLNCHSGFTFTGCQIFYSKIDIHNSDGVIFSSCICGNNNCDITVDGGGAILFVNNMYEGQIPINITNNNNVHFVNCYNKFDGSIVSN